MKAPNLDPNDPNVRTAVFGQQVQDFLKSDVGDYLLKHAERELAATIEKLKRIDPMLHAEVGRLQVKIQILERFEGWLGDAIQAGLQAIAIIDGEEDNGEGN